MKKRNADISSKESTNILWFHLVGVSFHIAIAFKAYNFFKKSFVSRYIRSLCVIAVFLVVIFCFMLSSVIFCQFYYETPDPVQWFLVFPLFPALFSPVLFTPCLGCSLFCWWKKMNKPLQFFFVIH